MRWRKKDVFQKRFNKIEIAVFRGCQQDERGCTRGDGAGEIDGILFKNSIPQKTSFSFYDWKLSMELLQNRHRR